MYMKEVFNRFVMNYLLIFLGGLVFWIIFNLVFLWFYNNHILINTTLSDKFKRRLLLLGLAIPGLNVLIVLLYPAVVLLVIIVELIKEELRK